MGTEAVHCHRLWIIWLVVALAACRPAEEESPASGAKPGTEPGGALDVAAPEETPVAEEADVPAVPPYHNPLSEDEQAEGWISLFDGHTLFGWSSNREEINWGVEEGAITADTGPIGLLVTNVPFADFELLCEYRMEAGGNSGLFLRSLPDPQDVVTDCYEVNIADEHPDGYLTGSIVGHKKTKTPIQGSGDWQTLRMTCLGNRITVEHDGEPVLEYEDDSPQARRTGRIGLQKNAGRIEFRKIILKPMQMTHLFNGEDLAGWREVPGSKSQFFVEEGPPRADASERPLPETSEGRAEAPNEPNEGHLRVVDGPGFIETEQTFQDFVLQIDAITHAPELNSGVFFRAMRGTEEAPSNGYEAQIHNGFLDEDRTRPMDAGTGAIFRRVDARRIVADDKKWFTMTLVAHGSRFATWVNGYPVVDWEDTRKPDENPRRGLRLDGGHISLQGHDPTTDLSFRNLRIAEFPGD